jgi:hypothetical protein
LRQALTALTAPGSEKPEHATVSALCELAKVSRNSLYRYHVDILHALREFQRQNARPQSARQPDVENSQHEELSSLRKQVTKLASLVDHYFAAYTEAHSLLARREQELAQLRRQLDSKPARIGR